MVGITESELNSEIDGFLSAESRTSVQRVVGVLAARGLRAQRVLVGACRSAAKVRIAGEITAADVAPAAAGTRVSWNGPAR